MASCEAARDDTSLNARTCSICIESFKDPKLLPCFHTFCLTCLEQYTSKTATNRSFFCPVCRHEATLPESGVKGFQTNFYIEAQQVKQENEEALCGICSNVAVNRCRECEQILCEHCTKVHGSINATRSHTLLRLQKTSRDYPAISKPEFCTKHRGELFRFYCKACKKAICRDCKLTSHEGHPTLDLEDVIEEGRVELSKLKVEFDKLVAAFDRKIKETSANKQTFIKSVTDLENDIEESADAIISKINATRLKKLNELNELKTVEITYHDSVESDYSREMTFVDSHIRHISTLLSEGCGADILNTLPHMKRRLADMADLKPAEPKTKSPAVFKVTTKNPSGIVFSVFCQNLKVMTVRKRQKCTMSLDFDFDCSKGTIDFLCPVSTHRLWVATRDKLGRCTLYLLDEKGVAVKSFHVSSERYEKTRQDGVKGILKGLDEQGASEEIKRLMKSVKGKQKPYSHTRNGKTCKVDVGRTVTVESGDIELELSAPAMFNEPQFSPCDVCWNPSAELLIIADRGSNSVLMFSLQKAEIMSLDLSCVGFAPCAVAMMGKNLFIGNSSGRVFNVLLD